MAVFALRVLVVEDMHDTAELMAYLLECWGYQSAVVYDGERAVEVALTFRPNVVFLDIGLPGIDGYEVARQLRRLPGGDKVLLVAITGYGQEADVQRCKEAGIDYHFRKPADLDQLQQLLMAAEKQL